MKEQNYFSIDQMILIVKNGGTIKTGIDIYNKDGILLLDKDVLVNKTKILEIIKKNNIDRVPVMDNIGGCWDESGNLIASEQDTIDSETEDLTEEDQETEIIDNQHDDKHTEDQHQKINTNDSSSSDFPDKNLNEMETRLMKISAIKTQVKKKYTDIKLSMQKTFDDLRKSQGEFDYTEVESVVEDMIGFMKNTENSFAYLDKSLFNYNEYLLNNAINVCSIGYSILTQFNTHFSTFINNIMRGNSSDIYNPFEKGDISEKQSFSCFYPDEIKDICMGFFLHDIGKILVPESILNKKGNLTPKEYEEIKKHSYEYGASILQKNNITNSIVENIVIYHHAELVGGEENCYPKANYLDIPPYTKICKLSDIYYAMTSKRSYKEAVNPINVVTTLFRNYAKKDQVLQFILHSFVKSIGIYPLGSIVYLRNGQMAYILDSTGPILLPFTDENHQTLTQKPDPIDISDKSTNSTNLIDNRKSVKTPREVYKLLPTYITNTLSEESFE